MLRAGAKQEALPDLYKVKNDLLRSYRGRYHHEKKIGIPLVLNMYDLLPFWVEFFHQLGYETLISPQTNKAMYHSAQHSIPSDTACLPAKVVNFFVMSHNYVILNFCFQVKNRSSFAGSPDQTRYCRSSG